MPAVSSSGLDASPEDLIAHADALSAQMALQSYYMPVLGGVHDLFNKDLVPPTNTPIDLGGGTFGLGDFRGGQDDDELGDGDYTEHLQQPGNTKKRKVPANMSGGAHGRDSGGNSGAEDELSERGVSTGGRGDREYDATGERPGAGALVQRKGKLPRATLAGLQHKELLRARKRQLQAVIGQLAQQGDTLALDQALSASYPFARLTLSDKPPPPLRVRLSRRRGPRLARAFRAFRASLPPNTYEPKIVVPPESDFSFACDSLSKCINDISLLADSRDSSVEASCRYEGGGYSLTCSLRAGARPAGGKGSRGSQASCGCSERTSRQTKRSLQGPRSAWRRWQVSQPRTVLTCWEDE